MATESNCSPREEMMSEGRSMSNFHPPHKRDSIERMNQTLKIHEASLKEK
jgi:hypothetical protein